MAAMATLLLSLSKLLVPLEGVIVKPGLWTMDWTGPWTGLWTMDCDMNCIMRAAGCSNEPQKVFRCISVPYLLLRGINNGVMAPGDPSFYNYNNMTITLTNSY